MPEREKLSDRLEAWLRGAEPKTLGSLIEVFGEKSFAALFVLLMAVPALPLPTGGVTHILEVIAMLLALELVVGRREIWLPRRWRELELRPAAHPQFADQLLRRIRWLERYSKPRLGSMLSHRVSGVVYGLLVLGLALTAFLAPPFTGLDTLPSMGAVVISLGILLEDALIVLAGLLVGVVGVTLVAGLGRLVVEGVRQML